MKYEVGNKVRIKPKSHFCSVDGFNNINMKDKFFNEYSRLPYCETVMTIGIVNKDFYILKEDKWAYKWTDEMIEGLVNEETKPEPKFNVGDKVLCWDGCPGVISSIDTHEGQIRYEVTFGGGIDFGYYKEKDLIEYHKPKYNTGDLVGVYGYETDVKIQRMRWDGSSFMYKVYLADEEEWITADEIAYKVEQDKTPVISGPIKATLLSARDRGRIDEIIKALEFLAEDKMICYADEIEFLKKIRTW